MLDPDDELHLVFNFEHDMRVMLNKEPTTPRVKKKDTVCLYWIRGLCARGDLDCEFVHRIDEDKLAMCQFGAKCQNAGCPYRHYDLDARPECVQYRRGFCSKGPMCPDRHIKRDMDKFEEYAFTPAEEINPDHNKKEEEKTPFHKTSLCRAFMQTGHCPNGKSCGYAHGHQELRKKGKRRPETYKKDDRNMRKRQYQLESKH